MYQLFIDEKLQKKIKKLDKATKLLLDSYIRKNLSGTDVHINMEKLLQEI